MINFSNDPRESEKQIQAIITYLVVFGYIDGDFDLSEKAFIREYIGQIVDRKLATAAQVEAEVDKFARLEREFFVNTGRLPK